MTPTPERLRELAFDLENSAQDTKWANRFEFTKRGGMLIVEALRACADALEPVTDAEAQNEIDWLRGIDGDDDFDKTADLIERLVREWDDARADAERLRYVSDMMDGIGDVDFHERAYEHAAKAGVDIDSLKPGDDYYLAAVRDAIDAARTQSPKDPS